MSGNFSFKSILKKWLPRLLVLTASSFVVLLLVLIAAGYSVRRNASTKRQADLEHLAAHQETLVQDSQALLNRLSKKGIPRTGVFRIKKSETPPSLAIPGLLFAEVGPTHTNLITYANPDSVSGFRIWISPERPGYKDEPTTLPFVTRFRYCDDNPLSDSNRP